MESDLDIAQTQIIELKAKLEFERKARKKLESMNKKLAKELSEKQREGEALERVCEELAKKISSDKAGINRMKREMEEERKMLRMAEMLREEQVQMKLTEAKLLLEEKISELEITKQMEIKTMNNQGDNRLPIATASNGGDSFSGERRRCVLDEKLACNNDNDNDGGVHLISVQRRASPEPENHHIKRGIKGFVEFPKAVRAIGSKSRDLGTKLECQKAQLRMLLKQKSPIRSTATVYFIWKEGNNRLWRRKSSSPDMIIQSINEGVLIKASPWRKTPNTFQKWMAALYWNLPRSIFTL
ncbi:hypothetical protein F0562_007816 [Nyssa sinensis]|uniref:Uncharacterized protein n=1 Tax=Nyssa sinensis TaxID=561372 RepID=A0A5J5A7A4_9ASTE|nr:hypothetical protein F0562_007816 [Nyssa sinensis]